MSPSPDEPPPKPKLTAAESRARHADLLRMIRLRMLIWQTLADRGLTTAAEIGDALGMLGLDAAKLLGRKQWREGDIALLEAAVTRLGLPITIPSQAPPP